MQISLPNDYRVVTLQRSSAPKLDYSEDVQLDVRCSSIVSPIFRWVEETISYMNINGSDFVHTDSIHMCPWRILSGYMAYLQASYKLHGTNIPALHCSYYLHGACILHNVLHVSCNEQ